MIVDADIHFPCMQINSTVKFVPLCIELHRIPPFKD